MFISINFSRNLIYFSKSFSCFGCYSLKRYTSCLVMWYYHRNTKNEFINIVTLLHQFFFFKLGFFFSIMAPIICNTINFKLEIQQICRLISGRPAMVCFNLSFNSHLPLQKLSMNLLLASFCYVIFFLM